MLSGCRSFGLPLRRQLRADDGASAARWLAALRRGVECASDNNWLTLAEFLVGDEEASRCARDEAAMECAASGLVGLLAQPAGVA